MDSIGDEGTNSLPPKYLISNPPKSQLHKLYNIIHAKEDNVDVEVDYNVIAKEIMGYMHEDYRNKLFNNEEMLLYIAELESHLFNLDTEEVDTEKSIDELMDEIHNQKLHVPDRMRGKFDQYKFNRMFNEQVSNNTRAPSTPPQDIHYNTPIIYNTGWNHGESQLDKMYDIVHTEEENVDKMEKYDKILDTIHIQYTKDYYASAIPQYVYGY
jgi:hypothetical protein